MSDFRRSEFGFVFLIALLAGGLVYLGVSRDRTERPRNETVVIDAGPGGVADSTSTISGNSSASETTETLVPVEAAPTAAPTTEALTTAESATTTPGTTQPPTTEVPTTQAPSTRPPTTPARSTRPPTTRRPTTRAPSTQPPITQPVRTFAPPTWTAAP